MPGKPGGGTVMFIDTDTTVLFADGQNDDEEEEEDVAIPMVQSLFVTPENFFAYDDLEEELFDKGAAFDDEVG